MIDTKLEQRAAFWDSHTWKLHQLIDDIEHGASARWPDEKDEAALNAALSLLNSVDLIMLGRHHEVLGDKLAEMRAGR